MSNLDNKRGHETVREVCQLQETTEQTGLCYFDDSSAGITRRPHGRGFSYYTAEGKIIRSQSVRRRIEALKIPPAWTDVRICPLPNGHIQATGRDARGRKQYIYHDKWVELNSMAKFDRLADFAEALPTIREQIDRDLRRHGLSKERVVAAVVHLLEISLIRVGNREYRRQNDSFGLTTLEERHVDVDNKHVNFEFRGKSGKIHHVAISDRRIVRIIKQALDISGQELFKYLDEKGIARPIESGDINDYLRKVTGAEITAKDFRTWGGTVLAAELLMLSGPADTKTANIKNIRAALHETARHLGNTTLTSRKYYVHPAVLESYTSGELPAIADFAKSMNEYQRKNGLDVIELTVKLIVENYRKKTTKM